jgi:ABC-type branched-subunit amino acid transport system ATPase component/ABC-type branched-subunit amino acid transport system permease subunit
MQAANPTRHGLWILGFGAVYGALALFVDNSYYQLIMTVVLVWAVMGLAWNLLSGYSGLISFGHAAFFGLGAYFTVLAQIHWNVSPWIGIPLAGLLGGIAGLIVGVPTFRLRGHYFALAMLAYPLALLYVFEWLGYQEVAVPMRRDAPTAFMQFHDGPEYLGDGRVYVLIALALTLGAMCLTRRIETSRFGMSLLAIKQDETAAEAAGIPTLRWKLRAIALSGAMAAAIGGFYAVVQLIVTPLSVFGMIVSAQALIVAMFGGVGTVWGPVIGALTLVPLSAYLDARFAEVLPGIQGVIYGVAIIAVITLAPDGVFWRVRDWWLRRHPEATSHEAVGGSHAAAEAVDDAAAQFTVSRNAGGHILEVRNLTKRFGGLTAVNDVTLDVRRGEILGIIGPNGAGKTTLFNLLNGFIRPDRGEVLVNGEDVVGRAPNEICMRGVGRTFQVVKPFRRMSIADNVVIGAYVRTRTDEEARALAGKPQLLLLDEIFAGLTSGEVQELMDVIRRLARLGITIVIIEHTMQAMVQLVDRFLVLDHGAVLRTGSPEEITKDPQVIEAYLGKKWLAHAEG